MGVGRHREWKITDKKIKEQLKKGIEVEHEHTDSVFLATQIAKDHLAEIPDYYDRLEIMEKDN